MDEYLSSLIFLAGCGQLCVLVASALVPVRLQWRHALQNLPKLHRQMYWTYGGYVVLAIIAHGMISIINAQALAEGSWLARCVCGYIAIFWGIRVSLQRVLEVKEHLSTWWLRAGYHTLTFLFVSFTVIFTYAACH